MIIGRISLYIERTQYFTCSNDNRAQETLWLYSREFSLLPSCQCVAPKINLGHRAIRTREYTTGHTFKITYIRFESVSNTSTAYLRTSPGRGNARPLTHAKFHITHAHYEDGINNLITRMIIICMCTQGAHKLKGVLFSLAVLGLGLCGRGRHFPSTHSSLPPSPARGNTQGMFPLQ